MSSTKGASLVNGCALEAVALPPWPSDLLKTMPSASAGSRSGKPPPVPADSVRDLKQIDRGDVACGAIGGTKRSLGAGGGAMNITVIVMLVGLGGGDVHLCAPLRQVVFGDG